MHTKLNYTQAAALFRLIAEKHKLITYFVDMDKEEIKEVVKTKAPALLYTGFKESFGGTRGDNHQAGQRYYIGVVEKYSAKARTVKSIHEIVDDCRLMCIDIVSYLRKEKRENRLTGFDPDSVADGEAIVMKDDDFYGWELSFLITTPVNLAYKPENWNE